MEWKQLLYPITRTLLPINVVVWDLDYMFKIGEINDMEYTYTYPLFFTLIHLVKKETNQYTLVVIMNNMDQFHIIFQKLQSV